VLRFKADDMELVDATINGTPIKNVAIPMSIRFILFRHDVSTGFK